MVEVCPIPELGLVEVADPLIPAAVSLAVDDGYVEELAVLDEGEGVALAALVLVDGAAIEDWANSWWWMCFAMCAGSYWAAPKQYCRLRR